MSGAELYARFLEGERLVMKLDGRVEEMSDYLDRDMLVRVVSVREGVYGEYVVTCDVNEYLSHNKMVMPKRFSGVRAGYDVTWFESGEFPYDGLTDFEVYEEFPGMERDVRAAWTGVTANQEFGGSYV